MSNALYHSSMSEPLVSAGPGPSNYAIYTNPSTPRQMPSRRISTTSRDFPTSYASYGAPSSPLRQTSDQSSNMERYAFPGPSTSTAPIGLTSYLEEDLPTSPLRSPSAPMSTAQRRISVSGRPRRPSPLLHEIQPPARRLSAHQVLLLTPFGGPIPDALEPSMGMRREGSSMGNGSRPNISIATSYRRDSVISMSSRRDSVISMSVSPSSMGPTSAGMGREPSMGITLPPPRNAALAPPRVRHSFAASPTAPSPLSQPLTTITSSSDHSSSGPSSVIPSREVSGHDEDELELDVVALPVGTVAMTRSNSLPVLTLRELEAMKEKDSELGIARGGDWAWVSRDEDTDDDKESVETPGLSDATSASSITSLSITSPHTGFSFSDPFAPSGFSTPTRDGTFRRMEETSLFVNYRPVATEEGYRYSPSTTERRMSDMPIPPRHSVPNNESPRSKITETRRPSAPQPNESLQPTPRPNAMPTFAPESPRGTPMPSLRPRITRYKTSPARSQGLGLSVLVRSDQPPRAEPSYSTAERRERRHARLRAQDQVDRMQGEFGERRGSWAPVDVVDSLEVGSMFGSDSGSGSLNGSLRTAQYRNSVSSVGSRGSVAFPRNSIASSSISSSSRRNVILIESTRAMSLSEFGVSPRSGMAVADTGKRGRFDSLDSAFPTKGTGAGSPHSDSGFPSYTSSPLRRDMSLEETRFDTFPRRASGSGIAVLGQMGSGVMGLFRKKGLMAVGAPGKRASVSAAAAWDAGEGDGLAPDVGNWHERRGSWAEGWRKA